MQVLTTDNTSSILNTSPILDTYTTNTLNGPVTSNLVFTNNSSSPGAIHASDVLISGKSLSNILDTIQRRLSILDDPSPKKLEKYAALKKAYDHYKLLEKLLNEE